MKTLWRGRTGTERQPKENHVGKTRREVRAVLARCICEPLEPRTYLSGVLSINFGSNALAASDTAGVVARANWNNVSGNSASNLVDDSGVATTAGVTLSSGATYTYNTSDTLTDGNYKMMSSYRGVLGPTMTLDITGLPGSFSVYDVYIYFGNRDTTSRTPGYTLGGTTYYMRDATATWDGAFNQSTATTAAAAVQGNDYVKFSAVTGSSFTVTMNSSTQRAGFSGIQIVSPLGTPAAPSNLAAVAQNPNQVNLSWTDNATDETGFAIDRATDAAFTQNLSTTTINTANTTSYNMTGLAESTTYYFRVRAFNANGGSANSSTANATTPASLPAAPTALGATVNSSIAITLNWTDNANNETSFKIDRSTTSGFTPGTFTTLTANAGATSFIDTGLSASTNYWYRMRASNSAGDSSNSNVASATTQAATSSTSVISINFSSSSDATTQLLANEVAGAMAAANWNNVSGAVATNLVDSLGVSTAVDLDFAGIAYSYLDTDATGTPNAKMMHNFRGGIGGNTLNVRQIPDNFVVNSYSVYVYWDNHQANVKTPKFTLNGVSYFLRDSNSTWDGTFNQSTATTAAAAVEGTDYVVFSGLTLPDFSLLIETGGGAQRIGICGIQIVSVGTLNTTPVAPSNLTARPLSDTAVALAWSDNAQSETGYKIERQTNGGAWSQIATVGASATAFVDRNRSANTQYGYRVTAYNNNGNSAYSNVATTTTLAAGQTGAPRLFITQTRLAQMKSAIQVAGSTHQQAFNAMKARVDQADWTVYDDVASDGNYNYARSYLAREAALMYLLTGNATYAQTAYTAVEQMYTNVDPDGRLPDTGYGLSRATTGLALGMVYDWALGGLSDAQVSFLQSKATAALDAWLTFSHANLGTPYTSNWNAVCRGGELVLMLATGQEGGNRAARFNQLKSWLKSHIDNSFESIGWSQEGGGYTDYEGIFLVPAVQALRSIGDTALDSSFNAQAFHKQVMGSYSFIGDPSGFENNRYVLQTGVDGLTPANNEGYTSLLLGTVPAADAAYYRWFYDRYMGVTNPDAAADKFDGHRAGTTWALIYYPENGTSTDPDSGFSKTQADAAAGVYYFRNRYQDQNDIMVSAMGDYVSANQGWNTAEAFQLNLIANGTPFIGSVGKSALDANYSTLLVDGKNDNNNDSATGGSNYYSATSNGGGYLIVNGGNKYSGLGLSSAARHTLVDFDGDAAPLVLSTLDRVTAAASHTYTWNINVGSEDSNNGIVVTTGTEGGRSYFVMTGPNGAWVKGWALTGGTFTAPATATDPLKLDVTAANADIWVAMVSGTGALPTGSITGTGLSSVLTVNNGRIRYDAGTNRIVSESTSGGNVQPMMLMQSPDTTTTTNFSTSDTTINSGSPLPESDDAPSLSTISNSNSTELPTLKKKKKAPSADDLKL